MKKAASGVLAIVPCSRSTSTLRAQKGLRPCWTTFLNSPDAADSEQLPGEIWPLISSLFNTPGEGRFGRQKQQLLKGYRSGWGNAGPYSYPSTPPSYLVPLRNQAPYKGEEFLALFFGRQLEVIYIHRKDLRVQERTTGPQLIF